MSPEILILLFGGGLLAGAINAVAGGSTFMTFPIFIFAGLPPTVASASNFVALLPGNLMAAISYRGKIKEIGKLCLPYLIVSTIGGAIGSLALLATEEIVFSAIIPPLMLFATLVYTFGPRFQKWLERKDVTVFSRGSPLTLVCLFLFAIYGGYFGAGYGVVLLASLTLIGHVDYHESNAIKNLLISVLTIVGIILFTGTGKISWPEALVMMTGATLGGYIGVKFALLIPQNIIRIGIIVLGFTLTALYAARYWSSL
jgi:uncharacterized membrane protein YfcA